AEGGSAAPRQAAAASAAASRGASRPRTAPGRLIGGQGIPVRDAASVEHLHGVAAALGRRPGAELDVARRTVGAGGFAAGRAHAERQVGVAVAFDEDHRRAPDLESLAEAVRQAGAEAAGGDLGSALPSLEADRTYVLHHGDQ